MQVIQGALPCAELVKASGLLDKTPGAPLPRDDSAGELGAFGVRSAGQLDKANADKAGAGRILDTCAAWQAKAAAVVKARPWWHIF